MKLPGRSVWHRACASMKRLRQRHMPRRAHRRVILFFCPMRASSFMSVRLSMAEHAVSLGW
jgi:hypothetical protein